MVHHSARSAKNHTGHSMALARTLCERHLSIGADGLMVVKRPTCGGDYKMLFFNSDGSVGEMCGNGARCKAAPGAYFLSS